VRYGDLRLPPRSLRPGGAHFQGDREFVESGRQDARKLRAAFGLDRSSALLDIGCGVGRFAIGLLAELGEVDDYTGLDVDASSIKWCRRHLEAHHAGLRFVHVDVENARYNKRGRPLDEAFRLPFEAERFDVIHLYSVFSHMESAEVRRYLEEFRRLLKPDGGVFLTAFLEPGVEEMEVNPPGYGPLEWKGALHCVRFSIDHFTRLVEDAGMTVARNDHGVEKDAQSAVYLRKAPAGP
jgi:SAM-dependent methyltransferase